MVDISPLVSAIIIVFNKGQFIRSALESLFKQDYPDVRMEIIVVDDGSTDNTPEILKEYVSRIIHIRQENKGIASARNKGMSVAKGEIITFLDADDEWHEGRIRKVVNKFIENPDAGLIYYPIELIDDKGVIIHKNFYRAFGYKEGISGWISKEIFSGQAFCGGSSFAFKKDIIDKIYPIPEDIRRGIDYYMASVSSCLAPAGYVPEILGKYRLHGRNTTMLAGQESYRGLAIVNGNFAYMREKVIEKIAGLEGANIEPVDINIIRRVQEKEAIFYSVLSGKRLEGIKRIPLLFKGNPTVHDMLNGVAVSFMALFMPAYLFPHIVKFHSLINMKNLINRIRLRQF